MGNENDQSALMKKTSFVQSQARTTKLTSEQHRIAISILVNNTGFCFQHGGDKFKVASLDGSIESFIAEQENQNTVKKTKRDVALLTAVLQTKGQTRS